MFNWKINHWLGILCFVTAILYLIQVMIPSQNIYTTISIIAGILLLFAMLNVRRMTQMTAAILLVIGTVILINQNASIIQMIGGFGQNLNLFTLFLVVPFLGIMVSVGGYLSALKQKVAGWEQAGYSHPYRLSSLLVYLMGIILNLGAMPITYRIAEESFTGFKQKKMGLSLMRAFGFCMLWSPYFVNMGLMIVIFDVSWMQIGWVGIMLGIIYIGVSAVFFRFIEFPTDQEWNATDQKEPFRAMEVSKKIRALLAWALVLLSLSFVFDFILDLNMLTIVSVLAIIYPPIWAFFIQVLPEYIRALFASIVHSFERLKNEIVIFISAGYFGVALSFTDIGMWVSTVIYDLSLGSVYLMMIVIIVFSILLAMVGVHPVVVMIGIGSSLSPSLFGVSPGFMAVVLLVAWVLAALVSPFTGVVLMTSSLIKESPWTVSVKNLPFIIVLMIMLPLVLYILNRFQLL